MQTISEISPEAFLLLTVGEHSYTMESEWDGSSKTYWRCHGVTLIRRDTATGGTTYHIIDINA